jgi:hypothetical protein
MPKDQFTEVTNQSWFGRIGNALKGILFGLILIIGSFILLFWNEGRSVQRIHTLNEGRKVVVHASPVMVKPANEGKLVHLSGEATTDEILEDKDFGIKGNFVKLKRLAKMYQWKESKSSKHEKKVGGGTETQTTYDYSLDWSEQLINSDNFKTPAGHQNPKSMPYYSMVYIAQKVNIDDFLLSDSLKKKMNNFDPLGIEDAALPTDLQGKAKKESGEFYFGNSSASPQIGDLRVKFLVVKPSQVTIIAKQVGNSFEPYYVSTGDSIELLQTGRLSIQEMFHRAETENKILTWILRVVGFMFMFFGLALLLNPIAVFADVIPFLGNIAEAGIGLVAFLAAIVLSFCTIAVAWLFYRPLLSITLFAIVAGSIYLITHKLKKAPQPINK